MGGPAQQEVLSFVVPPGEAQRVYSPQALAWLVQNFYIHPDGYLASVRGPCPYEPNRAQGYPVLDGRPWGLFHAGLKAGVGDSLLLRAGTRLYRHMGYNRNYQDLIALNSMPPLSSEDRPRYPDQFLTLSDRVIWTNGIDAPLVFDSSGIVIPLGFSSTPGAPQVKSPSNTAQEDRGLFYPNAHGYSWPGEIGTVGDVLDGRSGALLAGSWYYFVQWEDLFGNLSALSPPSRPATLASQNAATAYGENSDAELDDLTRQFFVTLSGSAPSHAVAIRIGRTMDTVRHGVEPRLLVRIPGSVAASFPDAMADNRLGPPMTAVAAVRTFRVMTAHQGQFIAGNFDGAPGLVQRAMAGFPGTFPENDWTYPDSGGAEVTGLVSHGDDLLAFTEASTYDIRNFSDPRVVARGIGGTAPRSMVAMPDGSLLWLSRDGFYVKMPGQSPVRASDPIHRSIMNSINRARMRMAVAAYDPNSGEYLCAVCPAGRSSQTLVFRYNGMTWRRMDLGITVDDICVTDDYRQLVLFCGRDLSAGVNGVWVLNREVPPAVYTPPARTNIYRSGWLRATESALDPIHVRAIFVGLVDGSDANATVRLFADGSWAPRATFTNLRLLGLDESSRVVTDIANVAVIGTSRVHERRVKWRWIPCAPHLDGVQTWAFELSSTTDTRIAAFAFDLSQASSGSPRGRIPRQGDV